MLGCTTTECHGNSVRAGRDRAASADLGLFLRMDVTPFATMTRDVQDFRYVSGRAVLRHKLEGQCSSTLARRATAFFNAGAETGRGRGLPRRRTALLRFTFHSKSNPRLEAERLSLSLSLYH